MQEISDGMTITVAGSRDGVPLSRFIQQMSGMLRALKALDAHLSEDHRRTVKWVIIEASYNSPLTVRLAALPLPGRRPNKAIASIYTQGVKAIGTGDKLPESFTPRIAEITKKAFKTNEVSVEADDLKSPRQSKELNRDTTLSVPTKSSGTYKEYTTIRGKLDAIDIHNKNQFKIYDRLTNLPIKCFFPEEDFEKARKALGERIDVTGTLTYNASDIPVSMLVDDFDILPESGSLPRFSAGEEVDITGGLGSVDYIRMSRDAE